ncbi:DUF3153 domain-containing protein [Calothrix rhizosoleniae]|uniref:DUF3153 domain-containing protein n=1 Tax=Calothrix rhizosoleniae TaxID=888997 RepID=UPI000B4A2672|nr:DUF3153 domain-containing protein [Calothrix rhizosoleniae]
MKWLAKLKSLLPVRNVFIFLFASLLLSGCVKYDLGVTFDNSNSGELVQHIKLGQRLTSFSGETVYEWLNSIEHRAQKMEGKIQRLSREEVIVHIPFSNGEELQTKFNQFFNPNQDEANQPDDANNESEIPQLESNLRLEQKNFFLIEQDHFVYDLDLRSLGLISSQGNVLSNADSILDLEFSLKTPWGANNISTTEDAPQPEKQQNQLTWRLNPGEINHIEVLFWLPNPLGIGTLLIIVLVAAGIYLRYNYMTPPQVRNEGVME